ncbi:glycosyltransferase involved in cell wall biosynthesis [Rhizobium azibense]|uniref:Glycosyltransferase involved in cell wall biosynthesis n=1 Tax=Rhizobium azibense TaxID=1136135 RepID=A0A4R3QHH2_9HYPH|nr:glycosyltransferase involved in cell wall biosynthesis [Rhizobium azibense]
MPRYPSSSRLFARWIEPPPIGVVEASNFRQGDTFSVDVCIVTNCAFVGGNASTTVTELEAFSAAGLTTIIVHCPVKRSLWKRNWVAERFLPFMDEIVPAHNVKHIKCQTLIARGPRMVMTPVFRNLMKRIDAERALYVVNNSAWSENGKPLFNWQALNRRAARIGVPHSSVYPISPIIREEARKALSKSACPDLLAPIDWPPAFKIEDFSFAPRRHLTAPVVIGRHGRDHDGKWLEDAEELRAAYPCRSDIVVKIMGGAETVRKRLGALPSNWEVEPFGTMGVADYLSQLDVFVNFPARTRDEAFGRTIIEAVLSGLPVILPPAFEPTFGDLALYCEPHQVAGLIERLASDDEGRIHYINACRREAAERFGSHTLLKRLKSPDIEGSYSPTLDGDSQDFRRRMMRELIPETSVTG